VNVSVARTTVARTKTSSDMSTDRCGPVPELGRCALDRVRSLLRDERGQAASEYAVTIIVICMIVGLFAAVVKSGVLEGQFREILSSIVDRVSH
jgi:Flp pilus assembly pilin Flp